MFADRKSVVCGGLGIPALQIMSSALKLRWASKARTARDRSWSIMLNPLEYHERQHFSVAARVILGNGQRC